MASEANVGGDGGGGREGELAGWRRVGIRRGWCGEGALPTGEAGCNRYLKSEVAARVAGAQAEVGRKERASDGSC